MRKGWQSPVALIRTSAVLYAGTGVGHTSGYPWMSARDARAVALLASMKELPFVFLGEPSTYWSLYIGWGILAGVCLFAFAAILWLLSELARAPSPAVAAISSVLAVTSFVSAWISLRCFFLPATLSYLACSILLGMAAMQLRHHTEPS